MMQNIIWTYWHQGWNQAPSTVQRCLDSWQRHNPGYELRALDRESLPAYISLPPGLDLTRPDMTVQKFSVLSRLALLERYGGVWADATVFCARPLNEWLPAHMQTGFFAFRNPGPDRLMSNWFIAAEVDNILLRRLHSEFQNFFTGNLFSNQNTRLGNLLLRIFSGHWNKDARRTVRWHSLFARKILRVYPYFIFHYTFNKLIFEDAECARAWNSTRGLPASGPHILQHYQHTPGGAAWAVDAIAANCSPAYKLDWRLNPDSPYWRDVLHCLR